MNITTREEMKSSKDKDQREKTPVIATTVFSKTAGYPHVALSWLLNGAPLKVFQWSCVLPGDRDNFTSSLKHFEL